MAGAGPGHNAGGAGGRRPTGHLRRARGGRGTGPVGASRRRPHLRLRPDRGVVGDPVLQAHGDPADADRMAHRRVDHHPGVGRRRPQLRPVGRAEKDRDRRDLLQEELQVRDGRRGPRHTPAGVGRAGTQQCHRAGVLRPARTAAVRCDHPCQRRWSRLHRHHRRADLPRRDPGGGPVPCREVGHRGPRRGTSRSLERRPRVGPDRAETRPGQATGRRTTSAWAGHRQTHHLGQTASARRG